MFGAKPASAENQAPKADSTSSTAIVAAAQRIAMVESETERSGKIVRGKTDGDLLPPGAAVADLVSDGGAYLTR